MYHSIPGLYSPYFYGCLQEELEDMWTNFVTELASLLAQPDIDLSEEKRPIPFDATSEKSIDDQK